MNTPRDFRKMEQAGVLEDYNTYMDECEEYFTISAKAKRTIPRPSDKLKEFFNQFKK